MQKISGFRLFFCMGIVNIIISVPVGILAEDRVVSNFQQFSDNLVSTFTDTKEASETRPGVSLYNPFGVGYLLANINEKLWNVSTDGISQALETNENFIAEDYAYLVGLYKQSKFKVTSTVYSRYGNVTKTPGLSNLLSHLISIDFVQKPAGFVDSFSSLLDISTKGHLDNELLPKGLWQKVFDNSTQGAFINTMYFKSKWTSPWTQIGQRAFNNDSIVNFLELRGTFPVIRRENFTAVIVPIQKAPSQHLVLVKPNKYLSFEQIRKEVNLILVAEAQSKNSWKDESLRIQMPALNVTNLSRYHVGLSMMGANVTFCQTTPSETGSSNESSLTNSSLSDFIQQPIAQANHLEVTSGYFEFSSATGSIVSKTDSSAGSDQDYEVEYEEDYAVTLGQDGDSTSSAADFSDLSKPSDVSLNFSTEEINQARRASLESLSNSQARNEQYERIVGEALQGKCKKPEEFSKSHPIAQNIQDKIIGARIGHQVNLVGETTLIFDTPFTWMVRDGIAGEIVSGSVTSLCQYNKVVDAIQHSSAHAWLHDVFKVAFWKCSV